MANHWTVGMNGLVILILLGLVTATLNQKNHLRNATLEKRDQRTYKRVKPLAVYDEFACT